MSTRNVGRSDPKESNSATLSEHPFTKLAMKQAVDARLELDPEPWKPGGEYKRLPEEWEFYVIGVGHALAHLIHAVEQLEHAVELLTDFSYSERMRAKGIRRHHHLIYNIENFIIRTQTLYDRILQLVDRVFHLLNDPQNCTHRVITQNLKVARTQVPRALGPIRKTLRVYEEDRHAIVHRQSYLEDDLRSIENLYSVDELEDDGALSAYGMTRTDALRNVRTRVLRETVNKKKEEFGLFNATIARLIKPLLDGLNDIYKVELSRLKS